MLKKTERLLAKVTENTREINLENHRLTCVPVEIRRARKLSSLMLGINPITDLPPWIGEFRELEDLSLFTCKLKSVPSDLKYCKKLKSLDLTNNPLGALPSFLPDLPELRCLGLAGCELDDVPEWIGECKRLTDLDLSSNRLKVLPTSLGKLKLLKELDVLPNPLPEEMRSLIKRRGAKALLSYLREQTD